MKVKWFVIFCICIGLLSCKKETYAKSTKETYAEPVEETYEESTEETYVEPTEEEIIEYTKKYIIDSVKIRAKTLRIFNIEELDDYYINHEVDLLPNSSDGTFIYIIDDDIQYKKIEFYSKDQELIDGKKENIKFYFVTFLFNQLERYNIETKTYETRDNQYTSSYEVITYKGNIKIYGDPSLHVLNVFKSDLPVALQGLAEGKKIYTKMR
ncbi:hypothetical protein [Treponema pectinovorum]|uniref:hypothetical protein n=1 Tax=Treponema pectinovorum TaxID=164 RepID=UPI0011F25E3B|nr:hypothetical protein [Treponema pectinovorum]